MDLINPLKVASLVEKSVGSFLPLVLIAYKCTASPFGLSSQKSSFSSHFKGKLVCTGLHRRASFAFHNSNCKVSQADEPCCNLCLVRMLSRFVQCSGDLSPSFDQPYKFMMGALGQICPLAVETSPPSIQIITYFLLRLCISWMISTVLAITHKHCMYVFSHQE
jgi:hypothetical protein